MRSRHSRNNFTNCIEDDIQGECDLCGSASGQMRVYPYAKGSVTSYYCLAHYKHMKYNDYTLENEDEKNYDEWSNKFDELFS